MKAKQVIPLQNLDLMLGAGTGAGAVKHPGQKPHKVGVAGGPADTGFNFGQTKRAFVIQSCEVDLCT